MGGLQRPARPVCHAAHASLCQPVQLWRDNPAPSVLLLLARPHPIFRRQPNDVAITTEYVPREGSLISDVRPVKETSVKRGNQANRLEIGLVATTEPLEPTTSDVLMALLSAVDADADAVVVRAMSG